MLPVLACLLLCLNALAATAATTAEAPYRVGYRVIDLVNLADGRPLSVAVWYPTAAMPAAHVYGGSTRGQVAVDAAPLAAGPYPLLVFSHGYGGSGLGAVFLCETLAARGWIVAAPDHHDRYSAVRIRGGQQTDFDRLALFRHASEIASSTPADRPRYAYRLDEMQAALDGMTASRDFGPLIDPARIAVGGHSFGGYTALGVAGTLPERHDKRIKAVLLFSTGAGAYLYDAHELRTVSVPVMLFLGAKEEQQTRGKQTMTQLSAKIFDNLAGPKYFLEVQGANHFSFNNRFSNNIGARLMSGSEAQFEVIRRYAIAFLEKHVTGRAGADAVLARGDAQLTRYQQPPTSANQ